MAFENFGKMIGNIASTTAKKAEEQAKIAKLGIDRAGIERRMEGVYTAMGRFCYNKYKNGETLPEELLEYCRDIDTLAEQVASLNGEIEQHKTERDAAQYDVLIKKDTVDAEYASETEIPAEENEAAQEADSEQAIVQFIEE